MRLSISCLVSTALADIGFIHNYTAYQAGDYGENPTQNYKSSHIPSPLFGVTRWEESLIDQTPYIFTTMEFWFKDANRVGPYIFNGKDLSMIYGNPGFEASNNARIQSYKNTSLFTFWAGQQGQGHASGSCIMMNNRYDVVYNISTVGLETGADLHECQITHDNTVLITAYETMPYDLTSVGGNSSDLLLDSIFQEIDIETGELLFTWRGSDHLPVSKSYKPYEPNGDIGWDAYHINSMQKNKDGNYFISLRRNHLLALIDGTDGSLIWQLGGRDNDFTDLSNGRATDIAWQHHARFIDDDWTKLTVFDNHKLEWTEDVGCQGSSCSRGVQLEINYDDMTAEVKQEFWSPEGVGAYAMGSYDHLPNTGNALIGWGSMAAFSEYTADGECVMDVLFGVLDSWVRSYRVYKAEWKGYPREPPAIEAEPATSTVYVSWNGATEVRSWAVLASNSTAELLEFGHSNTLHDLVVKTVPKAGFETAIVLDTPDIHVRVAALDASGAVLGATVLVDMCTLVVGPEGDRDDEDDAPFMLEYPHLATV
ncbi:hypothetical protein K431DRAFT_337636 [Polychaeton citri CBS 116435]|uniref:Arylsulfotransferase n=1 Tax=Polychaeton citri CBS 116435 TaxID=1314669 RepID=A0A9P4UP45_9PEZI|nr:hypothetical protein K431DRAFT_337636 [Polychaeton citri CBS 116435]